MNKYLVKYYDTRADEYYDDDIVYAFDENDLLERLDNMGKVTRIREKSEKEYLDLDENGDLIKIIKVSHI